MPGKMLIEFDQGQRSIGARATDRREIFEGVSSAESNVAMAVLKRSNALKIHFAKMRDQGELRQRLRNMDSQSGRQMGRGWPGSCASTI